MHAVGADSCRLILKFTKSPHRHKEPMHVTPQVSVLCTLPFGRPAYLLYSNGRIMGIVRAWRASWRARAEPNPKLSQNVVIKVVESVASRSEKNGKRIRCGQCRLTVHAVSLRERLLLRMPRLANEDLPSKGIS